MKSHLECINEVICTVTDVGCPNEELARLNRKRITEGYATEWWREMERERMGWRKGVPKRKTVRIMGENYDISDLIADPRRRGLL